VAEEQVEKAAPASDAKPAAKQGEVNMATVAADKEGKTEGQPGKEQETPPPTTTRPGGDTGGMLSFVVLIGIMFAIMYFMLIRPQKKKERERQGMLNQLKKDDKVVTMGGIIGVITSINDREVVLRMEDNTKIRFTRSAIARPMGEREDASG